MRTWNRLFLICLAGTICIGLGIIFAPRYLSRKMDMRRENQIAMVSRDNFSFLEQGEGTVMEHVKVFRNLHPDSEDLRLITSVTDSERVNDDILKQVYDQAITASAYGMLPLIMDYYQMYGYTDVSLSAEDMSPYEYWGDRIKFARYYSFTYDSDTNPNTKEILNFWLLRFSDGKTFDYYFLVDAITFRIYYAELYNSMTDQMAKYWKYIHQNSELSYTDDSDLADVNMATEWFEENPEWSNIFWILYDQFYFGCVDYYESDDYKVISNGSNSDRMSLVVLNYGQEAAYIEQKAVEESLFTNYQGISIGLQGIDTTVRALLEE